MHWFRFPFEIREKNLEYVILPYIVSVDLRGHQQARELHFQSIKVSKSHDNEGLIQFIDLYGIGSLVQHVTLYPDIPVNPIHFDWNKCMLRLSKICTNVTRVNGIGNNWSLWDLLSKVSVFWKKVEYLPSPDLGLNFYIKCAVKYHQLREITLDDQWSLETVNAVLDQIKELKQLQIIHLQKGTQKAKITRLIRKRAYLHHVEVKE
ncbi:unnamed protein product [Rhizopus stolonifer]